MDWLKGNIIHTKTEYRWYDDSGGIHDVKKYESFEIINIYNNNYSERYVLLNLENKYRVLTPKLMIGECFCSQKEWRKIKLNKLENYGKYLEKL